MKSSLRWGCIVLLAVTTAALLMKSLTLAASSLLGAVALAALGVIDPVRSVKRSLARRQRVREDSQPGELYVDSECCIGCGVPWSIAPELFSDGERGCELRRQPQTPTEFRKALRVIQQQDLSCVRYRGQHSRVLSILNRIGCAAHTDESRKSGVRPQPGRVAPVTEREEGGRISQRRY